MSFSEEQIHWLTKYIHREVKRIIDTGLMYTEEADLQMSGESPSFKNACEKATPVKLEPAPIPKLPQPPIANPRPILTVALDDVLDYSRDPDGRLRAKAKEYLKPKIWQGVNEDIKRLGGKYEKGNGWVFP